MSNRWKGQDRGDFKDDRYENRDRDRGTMRRAGDEVRSWFGDDEAAKRRRMDELRDENRDRDWRDRSAGPIERGWDRTREMVDRATDRDRDGRRGMAEWRDDDWGWQGRRDPASYYDRSASWRDPHLNAGRDPDYWSTGRSFGDTSRYAAADPYMAPMWSRHSYERSREWKDGNYSGRGPRGYRRGDERIREDVCERLTEDPRIDASDVEIQVSNGEVTLAGSVRTRDEKHFTEDVVERIVGVREVNNNLKVKPPDEVLGTARSGASMLGLTETPPPEPSRTK